MIQTKTAISATLQVLLPIFLAFAPPSPVGSAGSVGAGIAGATAGQGSMREREVWWNEQWSRILELSGSWSVRCEDHLTFLQPVGPSCKLVILARGTGEAFDYSMSLEGEVALAFGWIMVSPERPTLLAERPPSGTEAVRTPPGSRRFMRPERIERIAVRGGDDWLVPDFMSDSYQVSIMTGGSPERARGELAVHTLSGDVHRFGGEDSRCFLRLATRQGLLRVMLGDSPQ